jgi:hypothetical protein
MLLNSGKKSKIQEKLNKIYINQWLSQYCVNFVYNKRLLQ